MFKNISFHFLLRLGNFVFFFNSTSLTQWPADNEPDGYPQLLCWALACLIKEKRKTGQNDGNGNGEERDPEFGS